MTQAAVKTGQKAWERLQSEAFDAVISDIEMPHLSALELTRRLSSSIDSGSEIRCLERLV